MFANTGEVSDAIVNLKKITVNETNAKAPVADDEFWLCYEVGTVTVRDLELGITTVTTTYECTWYTLDGPGTPPPFNTPGPGNGLPSRP